MKYFKITDLTAGTDHFISSTLPNETAAHVMLTSHLDPERKYTIEEVSHDEFTQEIEKVFVEEPET